MSMPPSPELLARPLDSALLDEVAAGLDLREPNRLAVATLAVQMHRHYVETSEPFEAVFDVATGVGKTFIIAGAIDYFAGQGLRNFAVITPGQTILRKTIEQFSEGNARSLVGGMRTTPVVIHADNFTTPRVRAAIEDTEQVKLYVFSVQSLVRPSSKAGRKTHEYQEGLGSEFYAYLSQELQDLMVFADEHHCYAGPAFGRSIRELHPLALVGLTGTPLKADEQRVVYRYPLAAAIEDGLVKTPVVVGRRDDRDDERTQLIDGMRVLEAKQKAVDLWRASQLGTRQLNAVLLVNCRDIGHAEEVGAILKSPDFMDGRYADAVLVVHSNKSDEALAELDRVEDPDSKVRVIVQVGMLKEGWDVKTVYVIASLRASVSEVLTEQTMGRGLRLPFGKYTGVEMLDTLDILAHEQYERVLKQADLLREQLVDHRTVLIATKDQHGDDTFAIGTEPVAVAVVAVPGAGTGETTTSPGTGDGDATSGDPAVIDVTDVETRLGNVPPRMTRRVVGSPEIQVPYVETVPVPIAFSLAKVTDMAPYRDLGHRLRDAGSDALRRTLLAGESAVDDATGSRSSAVVARPAVDTVTSQASLLPIDEAKARVADALMRHRVIPQRAGEREQALRLVGEVVAGAGADKAQEVLSRLPEALASELARLIARDAKRIPKTQDMLEVHAQPFAPKARPVRDRVTRDISQKSQRALGYEGWARSMRDHVWFDSDTERRLAVLLDGDGESIAWWDRLYIDDLRIPWQGATRQYNPDFLVITTAGDAYIVEVKSDRDAPTADVQGKRQAALEWANHVNPKAPELGLQHRWGYLLATETDIDESHGSWATLLARCRS